MAEIILERRMYIRDKVVAGRLSWDGELVCQTLESIVTDPETGKPYCLSEGIYKLSIDMFTPGAGCYGVKDWRIRIGDAIPSYIPDVLLHSATVYDRFRKRINQHHHRHRGEPLYLTII